jgi:U3 small nucleolar RNA-associated protein 14
MAKGKSFKPKTKKKLNKKEQQHLLNIYEDDFETSKGKNLRQHNLDQMSGGVDQYHVDHINSDDDEEIDSDDAFGENEMDDQYNAMVLGLKDRKREAKLNRIAKGKGDVSDDSDDDRFDNEIILEEGEAFIDLSTLLDDQTLVATEEDYLDSKPKKVKYQDLIGDADMQDDEDEFDLMDSGDEDDEDEDDDQMPSDYDDDDEPSNLTKFITGLDSDQNKKKLFLNDPTSNRKESEFNFGASAYDDDNSGKLDLKSLLQPLENESGFDHLQNKVQDLMHTSKSQMATLKAPKVKRLQDKIIRTAAYEESKDQISQWETIVKENREKEHLSFTQTDSQAVQPKSTNVLTNHTKVENDMEKEIYEALQSHNIQDKNLKNFEDLQSQQLTAQELKDRQKKMMQLRNLMFKEELKAKRVSKIKSKAYRKVLRKEKAKLAKLQGEVDGDDDMEDSDEEATKNEISRARVSVYF